MKLRVSTSYIVASLVFFAACAPSQRAIETAIAKTRAAEGAMTAESNETAGPGDTPTPTLPSTPTVARQPVTPTPVKPVLPWRPLLLEISESATRAGWKDVTVFLAFENIGSDFEYVHNFTKMLRESTIDTEEGYSYGIKKRKGMDLGGPANLALPPGFRFTGHKRGMLFTPRSKLVFEIGETLHPIRLVIPNWDTIDLTQPKPQVIFPVETPRISLNRLGEDIPIGNQGVLRIESIEDTSDSTIVRLTLQNRDPGRDLIIGTLYLVIGSNGIVYQDSLTASTVTAGPGQTKSVAGDLISPVDLENRYLVLYPKGDDFPKVILKID